jgi:hypothetical protein
MRQDDPDESDTGDEQPPQQPEISPDDAIRHLEELLQEWGRERDEGE